MEKENVHPSREAETSKLIIKKGNNVIEDVTRKIYVPIKIVTSKRNTPTTLSLQLKELNIMKFRRGTPSKVFMLFHLFYS